MPKLIFVNDTAATSGGALTILRQFLDGIKKYSSRDYVYYIFCSTNELKEYESKDVKIINDIKGKRWRDRIKWDLWGLKNWSKRHYIKADLIISLQNTAPFYFMGVKQILYLHQAIPFIRNIRWNLFSKKTKSLWFYQNIYLLFVKLNLKNVNYLVVQTEWMEKAAMEVLKIDHSKIIVITPSLPQIKINNIQKINFNDYKFHIFYPAATYIYKNHEIIIKALRYIKDTEPRIFRNLIVHFTFSSKEVRGQRLTILINKLGVSSAIKLEGCLSYQKVLQYYKSVNLVVFPSFIESHPMPLKETALFGLPLLVSDTDFSREIISNYKGARFLDYKNYKEWGDAIIETYKKRPKFQPYKAPSENGWQKFFALEKQLLESSKS